MLKTKIKTSKFCECGKRVFSRGLCRSDYDKWLKLVNPEYHKNQVENTKRWIKNNAEKYKQYAKNWRAKQDPVYMKAYKRMKQLKAYGLTPEDYSELLKKQNGACAICQKLPTKIELAVDHNHKTGRVRGLLCFRCNFGMTFYGENLNNFERAVNYLKEMSKSKTKTKICYIAGRISSGARDALEIEQNIFDSVRSATKVLKLGFYPILPAVNNHELGKALGWKHSHYMAMDHEILKRCDAIFMCNGWERSKGAKMEHGWALALGLEILYEEEDK